MSGDWARYGTSKKENQVHTKAIVVARVAECQNLNSGNLGVSQQSRGGSLPSDKGTEFIVLFGWQNSGRSFFGLLVGQFLFKRGVEFGSEKCEEQVEKIYPK